MNGSPFVGPRPFETEDRDRFFGRTRELEELLSLIIAHRAVLVYAQSGAGKTSLLKAGVLPRLIEHGFKVLRPARVQGLLPASLPSEKVANIFAFHALLYWVTNLRDQAAAEKYAQTTLAEFLQTLVPVCRPDDECAAPMVIVFDQFEEFFTTNAAHWQQRAPFFRQLNDALEKIPTLKVVFVMREEYIAQLEPFAELLPEKLRTRMHLERLRGNSAMNAVVKPFQSRGLSFDADAAEKLMAELSEIRVSEGEKFRVARGEFVEPVQLQVVCQSLWENLKDDWKKDPPNGATEERLITPDFVGRYGDVDDALAHFYDRSVEKAAAEGNIGEGELRRWIGSTLITRTGTRGLAFRGARGAPGTIPGLALKCLEDAHVIRREERGGTTTHELTHDRFIEPIQQSNKAWLAHYADVEKLRAQLEEKAQNYETTNELLDEIFLRQAEDFLKQTQAKTLGVSKDARDLVKRSRAATEAEKKRQAEELAEAHRRAAEEARLHKVESQRVRLLAIAMVVGAIAAGAIIYNFAILRRAKQESVRTGTTFLKRAQNTESDKSDSDPIQDLTELRFLSIALSFVPDNRTAAKRTAELLLEKIWCPPVAQEVRYRRDALLAATFAPTDGERIIFAAAGDGKLLSWYPRRPPSSADDPLKSDALLFQKPTAAEGSDQTVQSGFASFSPDGQWLVVIPAKLSAAAYASAPPGSGGPGQVERKSLPETCAVGVWRWSSAKNTYQVSNKALEIQRLASSRSTFAWSPQSDRLILVNWRGNETQCHFLEVKDDAIQERTEWSGQLTDQKITTVAFGENGRIAVVAPPPDADASRASERVVSLLSEENLEIIPGTFSGGDSFPLPAGFQPNAAIFGPKDDELTLMSWNGARTLNLQDPQQLRPVPQPTFRDQFVRVVPGPGDAATRLSATSFYGRVLLKQNGQDLNVEPIVFRGSIGFPQFSDDGRQMLIVSGGLSTALDCMRLIDLGPIYRATTAAPREFKAEPAPSWLAEIASAVSALDAGGDGSLTTLETVRSIHPESKAGNPYEAVWQRFFLDDQPAKN